MGRPDRLLVAAGLLLLAGPALAAEVPAHVRASRPLPQQVPNAGPDGPAISLRDLSNPLRLEPDLTRALNASRQPGFALTVEGGAARVGDYTLPAGASESGDILVLNGNADLAGRLSGNLVTVNGSITLRPGAYVSGSLLAYGGTVDQAGGQVTGDIQTLGDLPEAAPAAPAAAGSPLVMALRNVAGLAGIFLAFLAVGFGLVLLGRPNLEVISDTVVHSAGRAFAVGLLAQVLALPTLGVLIAGLVLSILGILLVPFAAIAAALLALAVVLGGTLGVAHAIGETYTRRRLAQGALLGTPTGYRSVVAGLVGMLLPWIGWAAFGWVPALGWIAFAVAAVLTWVLLTIGLGAALLSRLGLTGHFAGRFLAPETLTDEYLWATPQFGVPAARRPGQHKTPPPVR